jgi:hypothetical protein
VSIILVLAGSVRLIAIAAYAQTTCGGYACEGNAILLAIGKQTWAKRLPDFAASAKPDPAVHRVV